MIFIGKKNDFSKILNHWMGTCTHFNGKETMAEASSQLKRFNI